MTIYKLDPLVDDRWSYFLSRHPHASIFHTREWLSALKKTYRYIPLAFTTSPPHGELNNAIVFCYITSWLTGSRLVSLPFSDHCQPLAEYWDLKEILDSLSGKNGTRSKYVQIRPLIDGDVINRSTFGKHGVFGFHNIDLRPQIEDIYKRFHESCIRRKVKKAERENLTYSAGNSEELLQQFRFLLLLTRRRHKLPPQPIEWYRNLIQNFGDALTIHMAYKESSPVASIMTLAYKNTLIYKYGCSDSRYNNLGGTPFLFWKAIQIAKQQGMEDFDLGRSAPEDTGLIAFKGHLGGSAKSLSYYQYPVRNISQQSPSNGHSWARQILASLPDPAFSLAGKLYRHLG